LTGVVVIYKKKTAIYTGVPCQVKLLITNYSFCIVQRATAQSKTGIFRDYDVAEAPSGFHAGWSDCVYFPPFNYSPSPPSALAVGVMFVAVAVAYIAAVVELSSTRLCSQLHFKVEPPYQDLNSFNQ
jgi:hypothetical protein